MVAPSVPRLRNRLAAARTIRSRVCSLCFAGYRIVSPKDYMHHLICLVKETSRLLKALAGFEIYSLIPRVIRFDRRIVATQRVLTPSRGTLLRVASFALLFDPFQNSRPIGLQSAYPAIWNFSCLHSSLSDLSHGRGYQCRLAFQQHRAPLSHEFSLRSSAFGPALISPITDNSLSGIRTARYSRRFGPSPTSDFKFQIAEQRTGDLAAVH
jgi:hypothetical protein